MKHAITWFEIPARDLERAASFYQAVLGVTLWRDTVAGVPHAIFPVDGDSITGALVARGPAPPGPQGVVIYLACRDVTAALDAACAAGGEVVMPITPLDNIGVIAVMKDLDGNLVGLHERRGETPRA